MDKYLLSTYYMPGTGLGAGDVAVSTVDEVPMPVGSLLPSSVSPRE